MPDKYQGRQLKALERLNELYQQMEQAYNKSAAQLGLSCQGCTRNCCTSYFQHHTYLEWAYLWLGLQKCSPEKKRQYLLRAEEYVQSCQQLLTQGLTPKIMCPVNEEGWCGLYEYRLMICRLHGVPNKVILPNNEVRYFPGCHRSQAITANMTEVPCLDRTSFYSELAKLEKEFTTNSRFTRPRVKLTLAQMLHKGPPDT